MKCFVNFCCRRKLLITSSLDYFKTLECSGRLGLKSKVVRDIDITSSSELSSSHAAAFARLDGPGAWCPTPGDKSPYIQITLDEEKLITAMETQGSFDDFSWARRYEVSYLKDGVWKGHQEVIATCLL